MATIIVSFNFHHRIAGEYLKSTAAAWWRWVCVILVSRSVAACCTARPPAARSLQLHAVIATQPLIEFPSLPLAAADNKPPPPNAGRWLVEPLTNTHSVWLGKWWLVRAELLTWLGSWWRSLLVVTWTQPDTGLTPFSYHIYHLQVSSLHTITEKYLRISTQNEDMIHTHWIV